MNRIHTSTLFALLVAGGAACGEAPERGTIDVGFEPVSDGNGASTNAPAPQSVQLQIVGFDGARENVYLLGLEIDDLASLPLRSPVSVGPGASVRLVLDASGAMPNNSPLCERLENPLPPGQDPCLDSVRLTASAEAILLTGELLLTAKDGVVSGQVEALTDDDVQVFATFSKAL